MNFDNSVVILKDNEKTSFLKKVSNTLINVKVITLSEFKSKYLFSYDRDAILYVMYKYFVIYEIAKIYLDNIYYIGDVSDSKIEFLSKLKDDLDENNLLIYDKEFKKFIDNSSIILYDLDDVDLFYKNIFSKLNAKYYSEEKKLRKQDIYKFSNIENEIVFVASKICTLIKNGVDINNIKIANVSDEYKFTILRIFKEFNIPVVFENTDSIIGTNIVRYFIDNYSNDIKDTLAKTYSLVKNDDDLDIYKQILNIVNKYNFIEEYNDVFDMIKYELKNTYVKDNIYKNSIKTIDINHEIINDEYVFLMNFNEGVIPINYKDEDYLSDNIKKKLGISTSYELNSTLYNSLKNKILSIKNIYITYSTYNTKELYISSLYDIDNFNIKEDVITYDNSNSYNKLKLVSLLDENNKYGTVSNDLRLLNNSYDLSYMSYNNNYKGIDKTNLYDYLNKKLTLSYSSINNYYECSFKYYLSNILKLDKYKDTFEITIGNIFHRVLSKSFNDNFDFDKEWDKSVDFYKTKYEFDISDMFFLKHLKGELLFIIDTIKEQLKDTYLVNAMYEKEIIIDVNDKLNIKFKGFVDKILYNEIDGKKIVVVIDYKTGDSQINLNNVKYGLNMQLPIYLYLINNMYSNVVVGGFYLQKILDNAHDEIEKKNNLKLCGYTNSDVVEYVDKNYNDSRIIKGLRTSSNGFYSYSNVLNTSSINDLNELIKTNIEESGINILNASFDINPKEINGKNVSCNYCKYRDICYMNNKNVVSLGGEDE